MDRAARIVAREGKDMKRDDIIRMARKTGDVEVDRRGRETFSYDSYGLERFAALVAAAEREACAKVCESEGARIDASWVGCAAVIRARGNK